MTDDMDTARNLGKFLGFNEGVKAATDALMGIMTSLHHPTAAAGLCTDCMQVYPCTTVEALDNFQAIYAFGVITQLFEASTESGHRIPQILEGPPSVDTQPSQ